MQPLIAPEEHSSRFLMSGLKYISPSSTTLLESNSSGSHYSTLSNIVKNNLSQVEKVSQLRHWWVYEREQDVGGLIAWLNIKCVITHFVYFIRVSLQRTNIMIFLFFVLFTPPFTFS